MLQFICLSLFCQHAKIKQASVSEALRPWSSTQKVLKEVATIITIVVAKTVIALVGLDVKVI